jgi:ABC-type multidrug transport system ATPase subunit
MDEPTAALDARAEYALFSSLRTLPRDRTVLIITHRLVSIRHADRIYVLSHGRVIESGTHASLPALGGQYAELYTSRPPNFFYRELCAFPTMSVSIRASPCMGAMCRRRFIPAEKASVNSQCHTSNSDLPN